MLRQLHPILAALATAFSSVSVVMNSLRLYKTKIK
jgi:Cu+-exporting ATPase